MLLKKSGFRCQVGMTIAGALGHADVIALVAPSINSLKEIINIYEHEHHISFNPSKSKLMSFNLNRPHGTPIILDGQKAEIIT